MTLYIYVDEQGMSSESVSLSNLVSKQNRMSEASIV